MGHHQNRGIPDQLVGRDPDGLHAAIGSLGGLPNVSGSQHSSQRCSVLCVQPELAQQVGSLVRGARHRLQLPELRNFAKNHLKKAINYIIFAYIIKPQVISITLLPEKYWRVSSSPDSREYQRSYRKDFSGEEVPAIHGLSFARKWRSCSSSSLLTTEIDREYGWLRQPSHGGSGQSAPCSGGELTSERKLLRLAPTRSVYCQFQEGTTSETRACHLHQPCA